MPSVLQRGIGLPSVFMGRPRGYDHATVANFGRRAIYRDKDGNRP
jgi:hypothetical protein